MYGRLASLVVSRVLHATNNIANAANPLRYCPQNVVQLEGCFQDSKGAGALDKKFMKKGSAKNIRHKPRNIFDFNIFMLFSNIMTMLCDFAGFDFGFEELEDIDGSLIVEAAFGVIELGEGG